MIESSLKKLLLSGHVEVDIDKFRLDITANGSNVLVLAPSKDAFVTFLRGLPEFALTRRNVAKFASALSNAGVSLRMEVAQSEVMRLGYDVHPSIMVRLFGYGQIAASITSLIALWRISRK